MVVATETVQHYNVIIYNLHTQYYIVVVMETVQYMYLYGPNVHLQYGPNMVMYVC